MSKWTPKKIAGVIDHTLLRANAVSSDIERLCDESLEHGFAAVCVNPCFVSLASKRLRGANVKICTVVDFPLGAGTSEMKALCASRSVDLGAHELDMVMNLSAMKSGRVDNVENDIITVVEAVPREIVVKVILETCYLTNSQIEKACVLAMNAGAGFVKTSTGFGPAGATLEAVKIMSEAVGKKIGIKAAGGIKDFETAAAMLENGATRIGASASLKIVAAR